MSARLACWRWNLLRRLGRSINRRSKHATLRAGRWFAAWAGTFAAVALLHGGLLRLPYFWDEAGYYIPAAYDYFRLGTLIPRSTLSNAHPPLPSIYLAACWRLFGFRPLTTRLAVCAVAALALLAVYRIACAFTNAQAAFVVAALTAIYPVWFAQSTLAHADIFAAAATLWAIAMLVQARPNYAGAAAWFTVAALSKETTVLSSVAITAWCGWRWLQKSEDQAPWLLRCAAMLVPAAALCGWYGYHKHATGFMFGNPEFLRYNATGTLHAARLWFALPHRFWHLAGHMNLWVAAICSLVLWLRPVRAASGENHLHSEKWQLLAVVFIANMLAFSVLGGALLTRYLLPLFPLVLLFHVTFWRQRTRRWLVPAAIVAGAFVAGWTINPPYQFAPEDNLAYAAAIRVEQQAIAEILQHDAEPTVLTAWPVSDYLQRPELGYVTSPVRVIAMQDFTVPSLIGARDKDFTSALLFTATNPSRRPLSDRIFGRANREYFGLHDDAPPAMAARLLGGELVWHNQIQRQFAGVVQRSIAVDAQLHSQSPETAPERALSH